MSSSDGEAQDGVRKYSPFRFKAGDLNAGTNLICDVIGTVLAVMGAYEQQLLGPFMKAEMPAEEKAEMKAYVGHIVYNDIFAGMVISYIFGTAYYAWLAVRLKRTHPNPDSVTALPYGLCTPAAFQFAYMVVGPAAKREADNGANWRDGIEKAWMVGCVANVTCGLFGMLFALVSPILARVCPTVSLQIPIAAVGFVWLGMEQFSESFEDGFVGFVPLFLLLLLFYGGVDTGRFPSGCVVILVAAVGGWLSMRPWFDATGEGLTGGTSQSVVNAWGKAGFYYPRLLDSKFFEVFFEALAANISTILPISLTGAVCTMLLCQGAKRAGDEYPMREANLVDGFSSCVAGMFGSPILTCVYIGHPQYKSLGGGIWYSFFACGFFIVFSMTGLFGFIKSLIPPFATSACILFVGLSVVRDAFSCIKVQHYPAAFIGLFPTMAAWVTGPMWPHGQVAPVALAALGKGDLLAGSLWSGLAYYLIQRQMKMAAAWCFVLALLSGVGLVHQPAAFDFGAFMGGAGSNLEHPISYQQREFGSSMASYAFGYALCGGIALVCSVLQGASVIAPPIDDDCDDHDEDASQEAYDAEVVMDNRMALVNYPFTDGAIELQATKEMPCDSTDADSSSTASTSEHKA